MKHFIAKHHEKITIILTLWVLILPAFGVWVYFSEITLTNGLEGNVIFALSIMNTIISVAIIIFINSMSLMDKKARK